jgi:hypothetical protein
MAAMLAIAACPSLVFQKLLFAVLRSIMLGAPKVFSVVLPLELQPPCQTA